MAMNAGIRQTWFRFPGQTGFYRGKVRDVYHLGDLLVMVATDRISAFDVILPEPIPYKGQVLNQIAAQFLKATEDIVPNWLLGVPDPNVSIGRKVEAYPVEMVVRAYLTGHAWRQYHKGERQLCGVPLPDGLKENDALPAPIITPSTKAHEGHDMDISAREIVEQGLVPEQVYQRMESVSLKLFERGTRMARDRGLILVDTKYEFGTDGQELMLIDEIHTPDSSRYFYSDSYQELQKKGAPQRHLSKEFVRQWLIENGFQGLDGQKVPQMDAQQVQRISDRYKELYHALIGKALELPPVGDVEARIRTNVENWLVANNSLH